VRRVGVLALLLTSCAAVTPLRLPVTPTALDARELEGTWHVVATTFPMWLDGKKTAPRFTYSNVRTDDGVTQMDDLVSYVEDGTPGSIEGVDTQGEVPTHFTWRGKGLLALFKSEWDVVFVSADRSWAIITFSKTLATPEGMDVISRTPEFPNEALRVIEAHEALKRLAPLTRLTAR
jgi:lipocalin